MFFPAIFFIIDMSRLMLNQGRMFMRQTPSLARRCLFSTGIQRLQQQQQQQQKNVTHFGFRDVAEEDKESLGKRQPSQCYQRLTHTV